MADALTKELELAREHVQPHWLDDVAVEEGLGRLQARIARRRRARIAAAAVLPLVIVLVGLGLWQRGLPSWVGGAGVGADPRMIATTPAHDPTAPASTIHFVDGSTATALQGESRLVATEVTATNIAVRLTGGAARFEVTPRPERLFEVEAGDVSILVLGTIFTVRHVEGRVEVEVERGRVRVAWQGGARAISAGERGLFPPPADEVDGDDSAPLLRPRAGAAPRTGPSWQELAEAGRFDEAVRALHRAGGVRRLRSMEESLLAADVMRLSGHAGQAAEVLRSAISRHPADPRSSVASFTLGRVLLNQTGQPRAAAEAFARARRLAPRGALAEDALAREVEALSRAGAATAARRRAEEYLRRYPEGRRSRAVRRFGGLGE